MTEAASHTAINSGQLKRHKQSRPRQTSTGGFISTTISSQIEEAARRQHAVKAYAYEIGRGKMRLVDLRPELQEQVREYMQGNSRSMFLMQQRESRDMQRKHARERAEAGIQAYRPQQETYDAAVRTHLDGCESGAYPSAKKTAEAVAGANADKLLSKQHPKRLRQALQANSSHPGMQRVNSIADRSSITAIAAGKLSTCLGALAASHKLACRLSAIEQEQQHARQEMQRLRMQVKQQEDRIANLEIRHDLEDAGKDWRQEAKRIRETEPGISWRELGRRVGKSDTAVRKYLSPELV